MLFLALHLLIVIGFGSRILLRNNMAADVRMAWLTVVVMLPYAGGLLYTLFGEIAMGRSILSRRKKVADFIAIHQIAHPGTSQLKCHTSSAETLIDSAWQPVFSYAASVNNFQPMIGNCAELMANGSEARARMLADMDAAQREINVLYYIWLGDQTGHDIAHALIRAAGRGVVCRAMVDGMGSRALLRSALWRDMQAAGVRLAVAMPISHPLKVMLTSRIDLRNHRKITLIDGEITYCGSQNCADEAFRVKAKYAPWVDIMLRMQGPVVTQMQLLFASDWMQTTNEEYDPFVPTATARPGGFAALVVADGPTERPRATPHLVSTLLCCARQEVMISTPYFVPDATVLEALCAAAWRGVRVTLIVPRRNDSWIVGAASRSTYHQLLGAGVTIQEYRGGLLHAKTLCVDGEVAMIGSTNLDLRSFDLNFENNVLLQDRATTSAIRERQLAYIAQSQPVTLAEVRQWPWQRRMWNNLMATLGPVL